MLPLEVSLFPVSASLPNSFFLFIVPSHHFVFLKTTCEDKFFIYTHMDKREKENGIYKADVVAQRGNGHFLHFPIPFILPCHVGGRLEFHTRQEKVGRQRKKQRQKISQRKEEKGEGEERHKKKKMDLELRQAGNCPRLKCREINIRLSLASLLATNKGPASSRRLYSL